MSFEVIMRHTWLKTNGTLEQALLAILLGYLAALPDHFFFGPDAPEKLILFRRGDGESPSPEVFRLGVLDSRFFRTEDRTTARMGTQPRPYAPILFYRFKLLELSSRCRGYIMS
jgi:hypothetical protein